MPESNDSIATLASIDVVGQTFGVFLIRPVTESPDLIVFRWPERATEIEPRQFSVVADSVVGCLAIARAQLMIIRADEL